MINSDELFIHSQFFPMAGFSLSMEEKTALQSSLLVLKEQSKSHRVTYWGKIFGVEKDYHIAQAYTGSIIGGAVQSYFSTDSGLTWTLLNEPKQEQNKHIENVRGYFIGNPAFVYKVLEDIPEDELAQQQLEAEHKRKQEAAEAAAEGEDEDGKKRDAMPLQRIVTVTEEARLAFTVMNVSWDTAVVPRGAFLLNASEEVTVNPSFAGLDSAHASNLKYYLHARKPQEVSMDQLLEREHLSKSLDFLDPINNDIPYGCWSMYFEQGNNVVLGRSLMWPGYTFYHIPGTRTFGSFYFGNGEKNLDLCFML